MFMRYQYGMSVGHTYMNTAAFPPPHVPTLPPDFKHYMSQEELEEVVRSCDGVELADGAELMEKGTQQQAKQNGRMEKERREQENDNDDTNAVVGSQDREEQEEHGGQVGQVGGEGGQMEGQVGQGKQREQGATGSQDGWEHGSDVDSEAGSEAGSDARSDDDSEDDYSDGSGDEDHLDRLDDDELSIYDDMFSTSDYE